MKTKWMRRMALVMAGTMLLAGTAGCTKQAAPAAVDGGGSAKQGMAKNPNLDDGKNVVGICWSSLAAEATQVLIQNYQDHYKEYGIDEIILLQAENNLERQIDQLQDLANQNCDIMWTRMALRRLWTASWPRESRLLPLTGASIQISIILWKRIMCPADVMWRKPLPC